MNLNKENDNENKLRENEENKEMNIHWLDDHPDCSVCLQPCLQPVMLPCQHIFCFLCLKGFAYRSKKCALCRREITFEYFENPLVVKVKTSDDNFDECTSSLSLDDDKYDWFYEGRNGWWQYDQRASVVLEEAFKSEVRSCELLVAGFLYIIDFQNMVQYRKTNPIRCRRVKRDRANIERKGVAGLKELAAQNSENKSSNANMEDSCRNDYANNDSVAENNSTSQQITLDEQLSRLELNDEPT